MALAGPTVSAVPSKVPVQADELEAYLAEFDEDDMDVDTVGGNVQVQGILPATDDGMQLDPVVQADAGAQAQLANQPSSEHVDGGPLIAGNPDGENPAGVGSATDGKPTELNGHDVWRHVQSDRDRVLALGIGNPSLVGLHCSKNQRVYVSYDMQYSAPTHPFPSLPKTVHTVPIDLMAALDFMCASNGEHYVHVQVQLVALRLFVPLFGPSGPPVVFKPDTRLWQGMVRDYTCYTIVYFDVDMSSMGGVPLEAGIQLVLHKMDGLSIGPNGLVPFRPPCPTAGSSTAGL